MQSVQLTVEPRGLYDRALQRRHVRAWSLVSGTTDTLSTRRRPRSQQWSRVRSSNVPGDEPSARNRSGSISADLDRTSVIARFQNGRSSF